MKNLTQKTRAYALKNAIIHEGKANPGPVIAALFSEGLKKSDMSKYGKQISKIVVEVNKLSLDNQKKEFESLKKGISERVVREGWPELTAVKKSGVIMRIAPSASGPLHVGHALVAGLNIVYVKRLRLVNCIQCFV